MALTRVLILYLTLANVIALQLSELQGLLEDPERSVVRSFVSTNKLWCGQAPAGIAEDALSLYKSMPRSKLYDNTSIDKSSCEALGYKYSAGEDPCYPGLFTFFHDAGELKTHVDSYQATLKEYFEYFHDNFTSDDFLWMDSCHCHDNSSAKKGRGFNSCERVDMFQAMFERDRMRTFISKNKMFCAEAPLRVAEDALNLYKTMPRGKLYDGASIKHSKSCNKLGYNFSTGEDPCYPGLKTFYRNKEEKDEFIDLYAETIKEFGDQFNFTADDARLLDSCRCKKDSWVKKSQGKSCDRMYGLIKRDQRRYGKATSNPPRDTESDSAKSTLVRTFVSKDKKLCSQGQVHFLNDALQLYQSMPRRVIFDGVSLNMNEEKCANLGYTVLAGADPCHPGLLTFFRNEEEENEFTDSYQKTLQEFGSAMNISLSAVNFLETCQCHTKSIVRRFKTESCNKVGPMEETAQIFAYEAHRNVTRTFLSSNGRFCAQAPARVAEGALALFKAMPRGELFNMQLIHKSDVSSCEQLGYNFSTGEDPCYPGLQTFYRNQEEMNQHMDDYQMTLRNFADRYNLTQEHVALMDACTCHVDSFALKDRGNSCDILEKIESSWVHHEPHSHKAIACAGGPFNLATRALAVLKSTEELPMHQSDQISLMTCEDMGFPYRPTEENGCLTGLRFWTATEDMSTDPLNLETQTALTDLAKGGYKDFTEIVGMDKAIYKVNPACHCAPNTYWGKKSEKECHLLGAHSQIRDWWKE